VTANSVEFTARDEHPLLETVLAGAVEDGRLARQRLERTLFSALEICTVHVGADALVRRPDNVGASVPARAEALTVLQPSQHKTLGVVILNERRCCAIEWTSASDRTLPRTG
jgi:hypothetical protein